MGVDLEQLCTAITDLERRVPAVKAGLNLAEREAAALRLQEADLLENIAILKSKDVITVASEYKNALLELKRTRHKLVFANLNVETYSKAARDQEKLLVDLRLKYVRALDAQENNVIKVRDERWPTKKTSKKD